jgi:hypothetical protein
MRIVGRLGTALAAVAAGSVVIAAPPAAAAVPSDIVSGVAAAALPALARQSLPLISDLTAAECPELPPLWVVAQVQAESGWDAHAHAEQPGGSAGLYRLAQPAWVAAGGSPWAADPPVDGSAVLSPEAHLRVAIPWVCANLRAVTAHLAATGKPTAPLDAMLVCHVAGCSRVTDSRTGIPSAGEAGCDARCAELVRRYLAAVHDNLTRFAADRGQAPPQPRIAPPLPADAAVGAPARDPLAPRAAAATDLLAPQPAPGAPAAGPPRPEPVAPAPATGPLAPSADVPGTGLQPGQSDTPGTGLQPVHPAAPGTGPQPGYPVAGTGSPTGQPGAGARPEFVATAWAGGATGCRPPDPTGSGCVTGATRHGLVAVGAAFGGWQNGPVVHTAGCWDRHAWNPSSDHSRGKACDFMVTRPGTFAKAAERDNGWELAGWLRTNAAALQVKYLIWQGRYWDPGVRDEPGNWGTRYTGGGIYDVRSATGGHYDHVHASFRE